MIAEWVAESGAFAVRFCSGAGVPLDSPEGREALRAAVAVFGAGRAALALPSTDTLDPDATATAAATTPVRDWWPPVVAYHPRRRARERDAPRCREAPQATPRTARLRGACAAEGKVSAIVQAGRR